jgi:hypothetical protein
MEPFGYIPPAEAEASYYRQLKNAVAKPALTQANQHPRLPVRSTSADYCPRAERLLPCRQPGHEKSVR